VSFAVRPWRPVQIAYSNFVKREASSILTLAFTNMRRKKAALKLMDAEKADAVDLPAEMKIRNTYR
jgi:hypothetical protein